MKRAWMKALAAREWFQVVSVIPGLTVWELDTGRQRKAVLLTRFERNYAIVSRCELMLLRRKKEYGADYMEVNELIALGRSAWDHDRMRCAEFVERLERRRADMGIRPEVAPVRAKAKRVICDPWTYRPHQPMPVYPKAKGGRA